MTMSWRFTRIYLFTAGSRIGVGMGRRTSYSTLAALIVLFLTAANSFAKQILYESITTGTSTSVAGTTTVSGTGYDKYVGTNAYGTLKGRYYVENNSVRYLANGGTPTITDGVLVAAGNSFTLEEIEDVRRFKVIGVSGTASVKVIYDETKR